MNDEQREADVLHAEHAPDDMTAEESSRRAKHKAELPLCFDCQKRRPLVGPR